MRMKERWRAMSSFSKSTAVIGILAAMISLSSCVVSAGGPTDVEMIKASAWWDAVQSSIYEREYEITWHEDAGAFSAINHGSNLRASFTENRVEIAPRTGGLDWRWSYALIDFGREGALEPAGHAAPSAHGREVKYVRPGITEWYKNGESGIEQGFIVSERPEGEGALVLRGNLSGNLEARMTPDGQSVSFFMREEEVLRYGKLLVMDANGTELQSKLTLEGQSLCIVIDDEGRYPIYIDPLLATPSWTAESDQAGAKFGWSVASAGDVNYDGYDDVIVGAYLYDNPKVNEGRAYVYHGGPSGLAVTPSWTAEGDQRGAGFGYSVAGAGDVNGDHFDDVIVGAYAYDKSETETNTGRVFVFLGSEDGVVDTFCWTADGDQNDCYFGASVAGAGDVNDDDYDDVIIGAHGYSNPEMGEGRAYIYHGSDSGPSPAPSWIGEANQAHSHFGRSVACAGNVNGDLYDDVIIGGYMDGVPVIDVGFAFVFLGSDTGVVDTFCWTAEDDQRDTGFGTSVAGAGDVNGDGFDDVIVGAYAYDSLETDEGSAYVFYGSDTGTVDAFSWTSESDQEHAWFGYSVAGAGDVNGDGYADVIVGAYGYDNPQSMEGRAYAFHGSVMGLSTTPSWTAEGNRNYACFGVAVAGAGDVNGDGYSDVTVGAHDYSNPEENEGRAYLYFGDPDPIAVLLQQYASVWRDDHAEVTWILGGAGTHQSLTFEISRRAIPDEQFAPIQKPDIAREGNLFTLRDYSIEPGRTYTYRVTIFEDGKAVASFETDLGTPAIALTLSQNHPNPFNPATTISYSLPSAAHVTLDIYDVSGRRIARLVDDVQKGGRHTIDWRGLDENGNPAGSGTYIYRLEAGKEVISRKMVLLR
jgi:hypothetical protein